MKAIGNILGKFCCPGNEELEQSAIRIILGSVTVFVMMGIVAPTKWMVAGYIIFALASLAVTFHIVTCPGHFPLRIITGQLIDMAAVSVVIYLNGEAGVMAFGIYLWVILGNGCRFGIRYMVSAMAISLLLFLMVIFNAPFFKEHIFITTGLLITLILVPVYFSVLLRRLNTITRQYEDSSRHDELTGLLNRRAFDEQLTKEIARLKRGNAPFGLAIADIDHFKKVNDGFGHLAGDKVLKEVAIILERSCRDIDIVARYGGEEFVLLMPGLERCEVEKVAERLRQTVERSIFTVNEQELNVTISVGIACWDKEMRNADEWFRHADKALYQAKNQGRNRVIAAPAAIKLEDGRMRYAEG